MNIQTAFFRCATLLCTLNIYYAQADIALFDSIPLSPGGFYNGDDGAGGFTDGGMDFNNSNPGGFWSGFAVSQVNDTTTPGFNNQYAAFTPGTGQGGSGNYGVVYADPNGFGITPTATFQRPSYVQGLYVNNSTYAALSMRDGDAFAKQFGGPSGNDPDWFLLTITGRDIMGDATGSVDFYLADYRPSDNGLDYIIDDWTWVDLRPLGSNVQSLDFGINSSDVGQFGVNTPAYFVIDNLTVIPEPATIRLLALSILVLVSRWFISSRY